MKNGDIEDIQWTSFRTLEPNPEPYTPMTQSILEHGVTTSRFVAAFSNENPLVTFYRGYLFFNFIEIQRLMTSSLDIPPEALISYLEDDPDADLNEISISPSLEGFIHSLRFCKEASIMTVRGLSANRQLPECPPVGDRSEEELQNLLDTHVEYLTKMVAAHVFFSALAEMYAAGIERFVPTSPSRSHIQNILSERTNSITSEMARQAASLETETDLEAFLTEFGHRCPREMELAVPRWRDDPGTLGEISNTSDTETESSNSSDGLRHRLARLALFPGSILERFRENPKNEWLKSYAYIRDILLEIGRRAEKKGFLACPDDVFFLTYNSAANLLTGPASRSFTLCEVAQAKQTHELNQSYSPPLFATDQFRSVYRRSVQEDTAVLEGIGVSDGTISGRAVLARSPEDVDLSSYSEPVILVTEFTDAGWTPLFFDIDGLVMERGSLLSHGSIVAREAGIAAVVNVEDALDRIDAGEWIEVRGTDGCVSLEKESTPSSVS